MFSPERISPDCPFKSNQRLTKNSILTPRCAAWLQDAMHTVESSFLRNFDHLTPWCDTHCRARLRSGMHSLELDSVVGCTPWSSTLRWDTLAHHRVRLVFRFSCFGICNVFSKNFWSKKDFLNNLWLRYYFHINICRHHRENRHLGKLLTQRCDCRVFKNFWSLDSLVCCVMHTAELDSMVGFTLRSFLKILISWRNQN